MRHKRPAFVLAASALLLTPVLANASLPTSQPGAITRPALPTSWPAVPVAERLQPWLEAELATGGSAPLDVMVSGVTTEAAEAAARTAGLRVVQVWDKFGMVVATGLPAQVSAVVGLTGVRNVSGDEPLAYSLDTAHDATRSAQALETVPAPDGSRLDGSGVSVAVIDSGVDGTHPFFAAADGTSKVVANLKNVCGIELASVCFQQDPTNDTDTKSGGGHGTHVAGIAAGNEVTTFLPAGTELRGAAPGAKLVGLSVGAAIGLLDATAAMNWVADHQRRPCAAATDQDGPIDPECPPIRVTNHSYGPVTAPEGGFTFNAADPAVTAQRTLVAMGVTVAWAAGNSGGTGTIAETNPPAMDPTPGVLMVASYDDAQSGNRDNVLSDFSSRGAQGKLDTYPDISAPGSLITSSCRPTLAVCNGEPAFDALNYQTISGTSMATPYVAGVVAQLVQADPTITPAQVEDLLEDGAHEFGTGYEADPTNGDSLTSFDKGHGLVDVLATLSAQQGLGDPGQPLPACTDGDAQLVDPFGDANQVAVTSVPGGPSQADLDVVEGRVSFVDSTVPATDDVLRVALRMTDVDEAGPTGEYVRIAVVRVGDPVVNVVAQRDAIESSFTATSGGDPLDPTAAETSATLTGSFDPVTDLLTVDISATSYSALVPGSAVAVGDEIKIGTALAQRDTGVLTLTADTANGSCGFVVGQQAVTPSPTADPTPTETATPTPTPTVTETPEPTETGTPEPTPSASPTKKGGKPTPSPSESCTPKGNSKKCG